MLDDDEVYLDEAINCPVPLEQREALLGRLDWTVFTAIVRAVADAPDTAEAEDQLRELSGFDSLREILEKHFFRRGRFLRCYRALSDAHRVLNHMRYHELPERERQDRANQADLDRMLAFIRRANGDPVTAGMLESLARSTVSLSSDLRTVVQDIDRSLGTLTEELENHNTDFEALLQCDEYPDQFSTAELAELRPLFGLYGFELRTRVPNASLHHVELRQQYWRDHRQDISPVRRLVADRAVARYGYILSNL
jgi:hypothetical protein